MKTTALFFLSFFLALPGSMNVVNSDQGRTSESDSYTPADYSMNISTESPEKKNQAISAKPSLRFHKSTLNSSSAELLPFSEKDLKIENWMTEVKNFKSDASVFIEDEIQIEEWMTKSFNLSTKSIILEEQDLNLEDWMTEPDSWKVNSTVILEIPEMELEEDLAIESWMTEPRDWVENN